MLVADADAACDDACCCVLPTSLTIDRKFDGPVIHRGPVRAVKSVQRKGVIEAEVIEAVETERLSTPSDEYETDIEKGECQG